MPRFITTGNYTAKAMQGMIAKPSDREAEVRKLIEATGGKLEAFYLTTGENDFLMVVDEPDGANILPGLIAAGATGTAANMKTVRAFTSAEFKAAQTKAAEIVKSFAPAG